MRSPQKVRYLYGYTVRYSSTLYCIYRILLLQLKSNAGLQTLCEDGGGFVLGGTSRGFGVGMGKWKMRIPGGEDP